ncbi:MAG TPA: 3-deoxy-8-phosphooctulonate synthase [Acidobacteriota bacterium]|jgi:2-dehydro-3-deoxyphosphooctonate aldolase (KDO 8-P synthase)|nr:3-deoxy-8-phosphooctulonate synthase [Acidobacteriota bacterium]
MTEIQPGRVQIDLQGPLFFVAGPCVIEDRDHCLKIAEALLRVRDRLKIPLLFKASYDKANRTSVQSFRGAGEEEGLKILQEVRRQFGLAVLTDVHETTQVAAAAEAVDVLQIPAFLSRQTDLIVACARSGKTVNVKKGQFLAPWDMGNVIEKCRAAGNSKVMLTERGASFGYNQLVVDFRSLLIMQQFEVPVIFDATHSVQVPGGAGTASSGNAEFIEPLARAAVAVGVSGIFVEVHEDPARALSDGPNALRLDRFEPLAKRLMELHAVSRPHVKMA